MWTEVKIIITGIGVILLCIVLAFTLAATDSLILSFLMVAAIGLIVFSDILIGWRIHATDAKYLLDAPPPGMSVHPVFTLTGLMRFKWAKKKPHGKREFVFNGEEASVIDNGDYPIHLLNGGQGCIVHEKDDENINLVEAKYAEFLNKFFVTDSLREIYSLAKKQQEKEQNAE